MLKQFKEFALKGNVVDMAVGVAIATAFGKIVSSIVADIITPIVGWATTGIDITNLKWIISPAITAGDTVQKAEVAITYGKFLQSTIDFFVLAVVLFIFVRAINRARALRETPAKPEPAKPPAPTEAELLEKILERLQEMDKC